MRVKIDKAEEEVSGARSENSLEFLLSQDDVLRLARETGVSVPTIKRYVSLLDLSESLREKVTTSEAVAGIRTLSTLAQTFSKEEQEGAYQEIGNFEQSIQVEILKRSEGNLEKLGELKEKAMEGASSPQQSLDWTPVKENTPSFTLFGEE